jgi:hypothetical protein
MGIVALSVGGTSLDTRMADVAPALTVVMTLSVMTLANSIPSPFGRLRIFSG